MAPRPARFSRATKAAKPAVVAEDEQQQQQQQPQQHCNAGQNHAQHARTCSVEVVITPSKKRRVTYANEVDRTNDAQSEAVIVTPTKSSKTFASSKIHFLPTPPVTPTISVSEHEEDDSISLSTPSTAASSSSVHKSVSPSPSSHNANIYARARSLLRLSAHCDQGFEGAAASTSKLVGRKAEREHLDAFLQCHFPSLLREAGSVEEDDLTVQPLNRPKAMYISGSPGTGKTALVHSILQEYKLRMGTQRNGTKMSLLNCTTVQRPDDIWARLAEELDLSMPSSSKKGKAKAKWTMESFQEALSDVQGVNCLVVLDEIDHLLPATSASSSSSSSSHSNVLSSLFRIALEASSKLVLIGIANALDLTQRYRCVLFGNDEDDEMTSDQVEPELLHFRPFQSDEMVAIVKQRLHTLHEPTTDSQASELGEVTPLALPVIMPAALELAAKKVAAVTGDLRSFLSLIRKAVEIFEGEQRKRLADLRSPSSSKDSRPVSPTKNILAYRNRKRKLGQHGGLDDGEGEEESFEDPLAKFDALTAPKLTPAHVLKATRLVSLVSSSSANNGSSSTATGINSSAGSLSTSSSSSNSLLQSKIDELNLHQRLALTSFLILLARRISSKVPTWSMMGSSEQSTPTQTIDVDAEASSVPNGGAKPSELHSLYKALLEREDLIHPVSGSEFSDLLSGLHTRGLVGLERELSKFSSNLSSTGSGSLAPPMMRRTSSSSSVSSNGAGSSGSGRTSRSPSPNTAKNGAQAPLYLLYPFTSLQSVLSLSSSSSTSTGTGTVSKTPNSEAASICSNLLAKESKRLRRIQKMNEQLEVERKERELAPRAGFNGNGLEETPRHTNGKAYVGAKDRRGRRDDEEVEEGEDEDHEKVAKLQEEKDAKEEIC